MMHGFKEISLRLTVPQLGEPGSLYGALKRKIPVHTRKINSFKSTSRWAFLKLKLLLAADGVDYITHYSAIGAPIADLQGWVGTLGEHALLKRRRRC